MTHSAVEAHLADPNVPIIEEYGDLETEPVRCDGCGTGDVKMLAAHAHFYPDDWTQLIITGRGDIIGRHYCNNCSDRLIEALPSR